MVRHLISKHPQDVSARSGRYGTPFHAAVAEGHVKVTQLLLAHCVDMDVWEIDGQTPLHLASWRGHFDMVRWLL
jgi:ankyrin repeat protein